MAYTTPPTFADGNILSASQLNILSDDIEFLHGIVSGINVPFTSDTIAGGSTEESTRTYIARRQGRYLHYKIRLTSNDTADFAVWVNGAAEYVDAVNRSAPYTWSGFIDLDAIGTVPAVNDFYEVYAHVEWDVAGVLTVDYFLESDGTTL